MASGLFILLKDEESLKDCVKNGFYGFFMPPIFEKTPNSRSKHYAALADYACCETGTEIFFFTRRTITYGGKIVETNNNNPVFYLNGDTSPLGRKANSKKYISMGEKYSPTDIDGVYYLGKNSRNEDMNRAMPFIIEFKNDFEDSGKQISSDELYFKLGDYNYPFPSNSIQSRGMCTLTPLETKILLELIKESETKVTLNEDDDITIDSKNKMLFNNKFIDTEKLVNESHLEFKLLADKKLLYEIIHQSLPNLDSNNYIKCRQVPLCPFRPIQFDLADICLYDENNPIKDNSLPNIVIELKKEENVNYQAYEQTTKYLRWLKQISGKDFEKINAIIIAPDFSKNLSIKKLKEKNISLEYNDKIKLYSLNRKTTITLE